MADYQDNARIVIYAVRSHTSWVFRYVFFWVYLRRVKLARAAAEVMMTGHCLDASIPKRFLNDVHVGNWDGRPWLLTLYTTLCSMDMVSYGDGRLRRDRGQQYPLLSRSQSDSVQ